QPVAQTIDRDTGQFGFPTGGGALSMQAGRDILGLAVSTSPGQWQPREGRPATEESPEAVPTRWGVDVARFGWNAGSLGGGDVSVRAGHNVMNLSVAAADGGIQK